MKTTMKRLMTAMLAVVMLLSMATTAFAATFIDVPSTHWSYEYVEKAYANGLVKGTGNGNYNPDKSISNAEWSQMIVNLLEPERSALGGGTGVKWYYGALDFTDRGGILNGTVMANTGIDRTMPGTYKDAVANATINRYDMAMTIYNIATSKAPAYFSLTVDTTDIGSYIADYQKITSTNYRTAVDYCYAAGFITGVDSAGTFDGTGVMTRGAAATVLCRLLDAMNGNWTVPTRGNTETPVVTNTAVKDMIKVTDSTLSAYDYDITVTNTLTAGKLSNGKDINATNIAAMLAEIKAIFPAGTSWGKTTSTDDSYYFGMTHGAPAAGGACASFSGMTFSTLFGIRANYTSSTDMYAAKPGDAIRLYNSSTKDEHWVIVQANDGTRLTVCEGNIGGKVGWDTKMPIAYTLTLYPNSTVYTAYK